MKAKICFAACLLALPGLSFADNQWYWGAATKIITEGTDGSFIVYVDNPTLRNTCAYARVRVSVANLGPERTKAAMALALSALHTGREFGVVVDLPSPGSVCEVPSSSNQGAGIRS